LKRFSLDGKHLKTIKLPGAYVCRPVIHGQNLYAAVLVSKMPWDSRSGFLTILDKNDKVISNPGGSEPTYQSGELQTLSQTVNLFKHPHDVCVDTDDNLYVAQWNSDKTYPVKLERV
jgi:sugar lactone lactonase YvrE